MHNTFIIFRVGILIDLAYEPCDPALEGLDLEAASSSLSSNDSIEARKAFRCCRSHMLPAPKQTKIRNITFKARAEVARSCVTNLSSRCKFPGGDGSWYVGNGRLVLGD